MAQPGLTVQLSPNSTELLDSECATSQTAETLFFLSSQTPKATQGIPGQQQAGNQRIQPPQHCTAGQQHPPPNPGNTEGRTSPSLRNSPWELREHRTHNSNVDKRQRKAPLQIHEKAPGPAVSQGRDTVQGSSGSGSVVHSVLTSPLMQGVGVSQLQECWHREGLHRPLGSGLPWQLCSPAPPT